MQALVRKVSKYAEAVIFHVILYDVFCDFGQHPSHPVAQILQVRNNVITRLPASSETAISCLIHLLIHLSLYLSALFVRNATNDRQK